jgi:asparagine N-glycosylation enzyme membrane subunit Stt3
MESIRQTQKKYCSRAVILAIGIGFFLIIAGQKPIGKGLILGTIFSIINFVLIAETLPIRIGKTKGKTFFLTLGSIFFRYLVLAVPLMMAIKFEQFNLFAVIAGIFTVQIIIMADHLFNYISLNHQKKI